MPEFVHAPISLPATTGLKQRRFVAMGSSGRLVYPANGALVDGVTFADSSTHSTRNVAIGVQTAGVADVEAAGSTLAPGALVKSSSIGRAVAWTTGSIGVGRIVYGSSGSTGRIVGVLLNTFGHSTSI